MYIILQVPKTADALSIYLISLIVIAADVGQQRIIIREESFQGNMFMFAQTFNWMQFIVRFDSIS